MRADEGRGNAKDRQRSSHGTQQYVGTKASRIPAEAGRLVGESFLPLLEHVPGFIAYYWIDAGNGVMASLSVYEDQAGADESVRVAHDWVRDNAATLIPNPPQVTEGQVVATDTA